MSSKVISTREKILKSALFLLEKGGDGMVRMSDIAKQAGLSRQAVYLHFPSRAELLIETTRYLDKLHDVDSMLQESRQAATGTLRLERWIDAWGNYIPAIYGVAKALMAMQQTDDAAAAAWDNRMQAMREGCEAAINSLMDDGMLDPALDQKTATDLLWTLASVRTWESLRLNCNWSQARYLKHLKMSAHRILVSR